MKLSDLSLNVSHSNAYKAVMGHSVDRSYAYYIITGRVMLIHSQSCISKTAHTVIIVLALFIPASVYAHASFSHAR